MSECKHCHKQTKNPKFCSKSCSISYNNKNNPKRKLKNYCESCSTLILSNRKFCRKCNNRKDITLEEAIYSNLHKASAFALVRGRARTVAKSLGMTQCVNCKYDTHVEIAHIVPIHTFPLNTKLSVINNPKNLISLCPNCHWEYDNKLLKIALSGFEPEPRL